MAMSQCTIDSFNNCGDDFMEWVKKELRKSGYTIESASIDHLKCLAAKWAVLPIIFGEDWKGICR